MLGILGYFLQVAAGHILYLALHLESGSFPRPLPPERERAAFADLRQYEVSLNNCFGSKKNIHNLSVIQIFKCKVSKFIAKK